jgi:hypothetical protein
MSRGHQTPQQELPSPRSKPVTNDAMARSDSIEMSDVASQESIRTLLSTEEALPQDSQTETLAPDSPPPKFRRKPFTIHPKVFLWELVSFVIAIDIFLFTIYLLHIFNGKPVEGVPINTMVAVAATLFKIFLMAPVTSMLSQITWIWLHRGYRPLHDVIRLDEASRGPFESLKFLTQPGPR